jgi:predicted RNase H-like HicB family nuclease
MTDYHINIFFSEEDGGYVADIPDLESCSAFGEPPEKALAELQVAKKAWLEAAQQAGKPIPQPGVGLQSTSSLANGGPIQLWGSFVPWRSTCEFRN